MKLQELMEGSNINMTIASNLIQRAFKSITPVEVRFGGSSFGTHLKDRLAGREESITLPELVGAFVKARNKIGEELFNIPNGQDEVLWCIKDVEARLNIIIAIGLNERTNKYYMKCITIMRKDCDKFLSNEQYGGTKELYV